MCTVCKCLLKAWITEESHERRTWNDILSGEKPYKISLCKRVISFKPSLHYYLRIWHGGKTYNFLECKKTFSSSRIVQKYVQGHTARTQVAGSYAWRSFCKTIFCANIWWFMAERTHSVVNSVRDLYPDWVTCGSIRPFTPSESKNQTL